MVFVVEHEPSGTGYLVHALTMVSAIEQAKEKLDETEGRETDMREFSAYAFTHGIRKIYESAD